MPERKEGIIAQAVTETEQTKTSIESSEEENPTESECNLRIPQAKMSALFDQKLEHLLNTYLYVKRDKDEILLTFVESGILPYDEFVDNHNLESLKELNRKKGNNSVVVFTDGELILVNNAFLYYNFLCQKRKVATANDPNQWNKDDFRDWKSDGSSLSTKAQNVSQSGGNNKAVNVTLNTINTAAMSKTKLEDNAWLS